VKPSSGMMELATETVDNKEAAAVYDGFLWKSSENVAYGDGFTLFYPGRNLSLAS